MDLCTTLLLISGYSKKMIRSPLKWICLPLCYLFVVIAAVKIAEIDDCSLNHPVTESR